MAAKVCKTIKEYIRTLDPQIILIVPPPDTKFPPDVLAEHLGVEYLAAVLRRNGINVAVIDSIALNVDLACILELIHKYKPNIVGLSPYSITVDNMLHIAKAAKVKGLKVIIGGHLVTFGFRYLSNIMKFIDAIIYGEAEGAIADIVNTLLKNEAVEHLPNTISIKNEKVFVSPQKPVVNLDSLPFPARDTLLLAEELGKDFVISIMSSRGCQGTCSFCDETAFAAVSRVHLWRSRSPENIIRELIQLDKTFDLVNRSIVSPLVFIDPNFCGHETKHYVRAVKIADLIKQTFGRIYFTIACRPEAVIEMEKLNIWDNLIEAGLINVYIGIENANDDVLRLYHKKLKVEEILEAVMILKRRNLIKAFGYIMFNPFTTMKHLRSDIKLLRQLEENSIIYARPLRVYPGIWLFEYLKKIKMLKGNLLNPNYEFINKNVEKVYQYISTLKSTPLFNAYTTVRYWSLIWMSTIEKELRECKQNSILTKNISPLLREVKQVIKEVDLKHSMLFEDILNFIESSSKLPSVSKYVDNIKIAVETLLELWYKILYTIEEYCYYGNCKICHAIPHMLQRLMFIKNDIFHVT